MPPTKGPGHFISKEYRDLVAMICQCVMNPAIKVHLAKKGVSSTTIDADIKMAANGWVATLDLTGISAGGGGSGVTGWFWSSPIELPAAPYPAFLKGAVIHIQSAHAIVTSGIRDAADPTGPLVGSRPGKWIALQRVPAQATVSGNAVWNLPQWPLPVPSSWDNAANFWDFIPDASPCT